MATTAKVVRIRPRIARTFHEIQTLKWADFRQSFEDDWAQGEHISIIGPTGCGKTTLALDLLDIRGYVVAFGTKPRDETFDVLRRENWRRIEDWTPRPDEHRVLLWPKFREPKDMATQRKVFQDAFVRIFTEGGWCVYVDEARYFTDTLKLAPYLKLFWQQGRSLDLSVVAGTQRPAYMPLEMYDQATHLFVFRDNDRINLTRIGGLIGSGREIAADFARQVGTLQEHEFMYINTRRHQIVRSKVEA